MHVRLRQKVSEHRQCVIVYSCQAYIYLHLLVWLSTKFALTQC